MYVPKKGLVVGSLLGVLLFVNLPSFATFVTNTAFLIVLFGASEYLYRTRGTRETAVVLGGFVVLVTALAFAGLLPGVTVSCTLEAIIHPPAEDPVRGEVVWGGYDGFRLHGCDKGRYPWYFEDLSEDRIQALCEEQPDRQYCTVQRDFQDLRS